MKFGGVGSMRFTRPFGALCLLALGSSVFPPACRAQSDGPVPGLWDIPFQKWVSEGERKEIPWEVKVFPPGLRLHQRLAVRINAQVKGEVLERLGPVQELMLVGRMADSDGHWLESHGIGWTRVDKPLPDGASLAMTLQAVVLPGEYTLGLILYDRVTGQRSVTRRALHVPRIHNDPLADAFRDLPRVEFLQTRGSSGVAVRTGVTSRLWLPVTTRRRVRIEVLVNFSLSEQYSGLKWADQFNVGAMLTLLSVLSQLEVSNGSLRVTGLDLMRRRVVFEQDNVQDLDWGRLIKKLQEANPQVVDKETLEGRKQNAAFFREEMARRLAEEAAPPAAAPPRGDAHPTERQAPTRVFIVVSSAMLFPRGADLAPLPRREHTNIRVFHLRYQVGPSNLWDELNRILKPLEPRTFTMDSPMNVRRALGEILRELRRL